MTRPPQGMLPPVPALDPAGAEPLAVQLHRILRETALGLGPGARLPSTRALAAELGVSRNTVQAAFDQLAAEGYLEARVGSGTRVARDLPEAFLRVEPRSAPKPAPGPAPGLSARGRALAGTSWQASPYAGPGTPFRLGSPSTADAPLETWTRLLRRHWQRATPASLDYRDPQGHPRLREALARYLGAARGVACGPEQILVTGGSQQGLDLIGKLLLDPGDAVWFEEPGYSGARGALVAAGARLVPVPVDGEGLDVAAGARRAPEARLAYVTPSHQFPLGVTLRLPRRLALLEWAARAGAWILEDDYDSEFRYASRPLPALQGLDAQGRVLYLGTFSKALFPALRLGYLVLPPALVPAFKAGRAFAGGGPPDVEQLAAADFLDEGHFERHVRRMRLRYQQRRDALQDAVRRHLGDRLELMPSEGGMHLVGLLPPGADDRAVARAGAAAGLDLAPLSTFCAEPPPRGGLLLGYAAFSPAEIEAAVRRLATVIGPG